jgi:hypothetical protein
VAAVTTSGVNSAFLNHGGTTDIATYTLVFPNPFLLATRFGASRSNGIPSLVRSRTELS